MSRKLQLDSAIAADIQTVNADSYIDSLKMIDIDNIEPNRNNFYEISEIEWEMWELLRKKYDSFVKKNGCINDSSNSQVFSRDDDYNSLCALEIIDEENTP